MHNSIVIGVEPTSLLNFRMELLKSMTLLNYKVTTISNKPSNSQVSKLKTLGVTSEVVKFSRGKFSITADLKTFFSLIRRFKVIKPDLILAYTIKPVIWGGMASRLFKTDFYALITGLGFSFHGDSFKRKLLTRLVVFLYRLALTNSKAVIFQNKESRDIFVKKGIISFDKTYVVNGSGVNIENFPIVNFPNRNTINFLCISRLLSEKGLREYAAAAKIVKQIFPDVEFNLVGSEELSPDAISLNEVNSWLNYINYMGFTSDVRACIADSHVYVLPSYHEGLPRSVLEAMSMGRPVITTEAIGCKDTVVDGFNGFLVPVYSVDKLVEKMIWFIENTNKIKPMGMNSRKLVEDKFDVYKINKEMLKIMGIK